MHRIIQFAGKSGQISISNDAENFRLQLEIHFPDTSMIHNIISRTRNMFDLDSDPVLVANCLELDAKSRPLLKKYPGIRLPSGWDAFEVSVASILGQLVSVERGRALVSDLIEMLGVDSNTSIEGRTIKFFPTPEAIAGSKLEGLKTTSMRKQTLIAFAKAVSEKKISLEPTQDVDEFLKNVRSVKGIGPWTANYMALKVLRHTDAFPGTDLILARALEIHTAEVVSQMSPWRGYAAALFWREYAATLKKPKNTKKGKTT
jgi:AraC family transcriptional regulator of adaptative response / DNA-3-methyladenine glycosylase II